MQLTPGDCFAHAENKLYFYCDTHAVPVCMACTIVNHRGCAIRETVQPYTAANCVADIRAALARLDAANPVAEGISATIPSAVSTRPGGWSNLYGAGSSSAPMLTAEPSVDQLMDWSKAYAGTAAAGTAATTGTAKVAAGAATGTAGTAAGAASGTDLTVEQLVAAAANPPYVNSASQDCFLMDGCKRGHCLQANLGSGLGMTAPPASSLRPAAEGSKKLAFDNPLQQFMGPHTDAGMDIRAAPRLLFPYPK